MRIGLCCGTPDPSDLRRAADAGYEYAEISIRGVMQKEKAEREAFLRDLTRGPLPLYSGNCLFPGEMRLVGPEADKKRLAAYLDRAFGELSDAGMRVAVLGSGAARRIPEGYTKERAEAEFGAFCRDAVEPAAERFGIEVVIEPLCAEETDLLNRVDETGVFVRKLGLAHVSLLADLFHMAANGEGTEGITGSGGRLLHVHIARPEGRTWPLPGDGTDYGPLFEALAGIGYRGGVTYEGRYPKTEEEWKEAGRSAAFLKKLGR